MIGTRIEAEKAEQRQCCSKRGADWTDQTRMLAVRTDEWTDSSKTSLREITGFSDQLWGTREREELMATARPLSWLPWVPSRSETVKGSKSG